MEDDEKAEKLRAYQREWSRNNREKRKGYVAKWREKNRVEISRREKERREENREARLVRGAAYRAKNRERILAYSKAYYATHKTEHYLGRMKAHLKKKYNLTPEQHAEMFLVQSGRCAICGEGVTDARKLHVDHDHSNEKVRALLCYSCNSGLGNFKDDEDRLASAIRYLKVWKKRHAAT